MYDEITEKQKVAEERNLDETETESYCNLLDVINMLVYIFLKKRQSRMEIAEISKAMDKICKRYLKYNSKTETYEPEISKHYSVIEFFENEEETPRYKDPNAIDKLAVMKDFLMMAKSGKYKNRTAIYRVLAKKYDRGHSIIVNYCKALTFEVSL